MEARSAAGRRRHFLFAHHLRATTRWQPDLAALRSVRTRIVVGIGRRLGRAALRPLAAALGIEPTMFRSRSWRSTAGRRPRPVRSPRLVGPVYASLARTFQSGGCRAGCSSGSTYRRTGSSSTHLVSRGRGADYSRAGDAGGVRRHEPGRTRTPARRGPQRHGGTHQELVEHHRVAGS